MPRFEHKSIPAELKMVGDDNGRLAGAAAVMLNIDAGQDIIAPGAFRDAITTPSDIFVGGLNHNWDQPIGRLREAREDGKSLYFETGDIVETTHGLDVKKLVNAGVINRASIGYKALEFKHLNKPEEIKSFWGSHGYKPDATDLERAGAGRVRVLTKLRLFEVSPVTIPMNDRAAISAVKMFGYGMPMGDEPADAIRHSAVEAFIGYLCGMIHGAVASEMATLDDIEKFIRQAYGRNCDGLVRYVRAVLTADSEEDAAEGVGEALETMAAKFKEALDHPSAFAPIHVPEIGLVPGLKIVDHSRKVVSANAEVRAVNSAYVERVEGRDEAWFKVGRVFSQSHIDEIDSVAESQESMGRAHIENATRLRKLTDKAKASRSSNATNPMDGAAAEPAKSAAAGPPEVKATSGVVPFATGPTMDGAWDGAAADVRVREWASPDGSGDKDKVDWGRYAKAFAYVDAEGAGSSFGAYHLQHHDVEDGTLKVHRRGLAAAAGIVRGARGGAKFVEGLPAGAADGIRAHLGKHYEQFDEPAPWDKGGKSAGAPADADGPDLPPPADPSPPAAPPRVPPGEVKGFFTAYIDTIVAPGLGIATHGR